MNYANMMWHEQLEKTIVQEYECSTAIVKLVLRKLSQHQHLFLHLLTAPNTCTCSLHLPPQLTCSLHLSMLSVVLVIVMALRAIPNPLWCTLGQCSWVHMAEDIIWLTAILQRKWNAAWLKLFLNNWLLTMWKTSVTTDLRFLQGDNLQWSFKPKFL